MVITEKDVILRIKMNQRRETTFFHATARFLENQFLNYLGHARVSFKFDWTQPLVNLCHVRTYSVEMKIYNQTHYFTVINSKRTQ